MEEKEIMEKLGNVIKEHGIRIDGFVPLLDKLDKTNQILEKIQKLVYFIEDRQHRMEEAKKDKA